MHGPAYWRAGTDGEILRGCWFRDDPEPCTHHDPEFLVGFGEFDPATAPTVWKRYRFEESNGSGKGGHWDTLHPLEAAGSRSDPVLVDPEAHPFLEIFDRVKNRDHVFWDLREVPEGAVNSLHTLPGKSWLQARCENGRVPPYYESWALPRGAAGTDPVFALVHGYTGSPGNWDNFVNNLDDNGYFVPLLPGHGLPPEGFAEFGANEWSESVHYWSNRLAVEHDSVVGVGLSMGGALAVTNWQQYDALVLINTPFRVPDWRRFFFPFFSWFKTYHQFEDSDKVIPVSSLRDLQEVLRRCRETLEQVDVPVLVINHGEDETVSPDHGRTITSRLPHAEHVIFEEGIHESPTDPEVARQLVKRIREWLTERGIQEG